MIEKRAFDTLGHANHGWLNARHHFSFANYYEPQRMGWGALRVWNDDEIAAGTGFGMHPHRDMEIITYAREGAITHKDNMGNEGRTEAGDVQVMSAGTGVMHSEYNLEQDRTSIFQIWIIPAEAGGDPRWETVAFPKTDRSGKWSVLASGNPDAEGGALIRQDARILGAFLKAGEHVTYILKPGRHAYLTVAAGQAEVNGVELDTRDGAAIRDVETLTITASSDAEIVLADTP